MECNTFTSRPTNSLSGRSYFLRVLETMPGRLQACGPCGQESSHHEYIIILIVVSCFILLTALGVVIWLLAYRRSKRRRRRRRKLTMLASPLLVSPWKVYTLRDLALFTNHFASANKLGEGAIGTTYKGILYDGTVVAIKKVRRLALQSVNDFLSEMRKIGQLRHANLVPMKGCCFELDEGYIIYEFLSNGTLDKWLHSLPRDASPLDWNARLHIAIGVAEGLVVLHDKVKLNVVHRNVRASSVLLDDKFNARLLGVGLANLTLLRESTSETTVIVGTHGYLAPEFVYRNELTTRSDVFSFGVLLLEIITGRRPTTAGIGENTEIQSIFEWATPLVEAERWMELIDKSIGTVPNSLQVKKVVDLVYACTQHVPAMRPRMSYVVYELQELCTSPPFEFHSCELGATPLI